MQHIDDFSAHTTFDGSTATVRLTGTAGMASLDALTKEVAGIIAAEPKSVIFDFADLSFLGSVAVGALVTCAMHVRKRDGESKIINASPEVADMLLKCRLDHFFDL